MFNNYLLETEIINYSDKEIQRVINELRKKSKDNIEYIKIAYEFVRDEISHSADIENSNKVTCKASDVLEYREGICFAKSHLLSAILRGNDIPSGFSYQKLILDDETKPYLVLHGLNTVYIEELHKWIRLDARGNKAGINAEFSLSKEKLAFQVREWLGEQDLKRNHPNPDINVIWALSKYTTFDILWDKLPRC